MARVCIFCSGRPGSHEHVFPNWLNSIFPVDHVAPNPEWALKVGRLGDDTPISRTWSPNEIASVTSKLVCHDCNTGWMAQLEGDAKGLLEPMITGNATTLDQASQLVVATWAVKTVMTIETTVPSPAEDRFLPEQCALVREQLRPPGHVRVFSAGITGPIPPMGYWVARAHMEANGAHICDLHFYTLQIGTLVLQVARPEPPPPRFGALSALSHPMKGEVPVFPPVTAFTWPPEVTLDAGSFVVYTSRGLQVPAGWQVPMPIGNPEQ